MIRSRKLTTKSKEEGYRLREPTICINHRSSSFAKPFITPPWGLQVLITDCNNIIRGADMQVTFSSHVYIEGNLLVDYLASLGHSININSSELYQEF
uniref:Uncharacterized protein n=1 Tax=Nelumbo nucifera TaxID=4432 RepID=A0A822ZE64_NELNU|nr:TPA_asm: hypothetical protein HUJ06_014211 [Nelumbo nucifera]